MEVNQNWITSNRHVLPEELTVSFSTESAQKYTKIWQNLNKISKQKYILSKQKSHKLHYNDQQVLKKCQQGHKNRAKNIEKYSREPSRGLVVR